MAASSLPPLTFAAGEVDLSGMPPADADAWLDSHPLIVPSVALARSYLLSRALAGMFGPVQEWAWVDGERDRDSIINNWFATERGKVAYARLSPEQQQVANAERAARIAQEEADKARRDAEWAAKVEAAK
ncbi:MAG: hypothetical protein ABII76_25440, partial [Pseudomonadota bacterium]